MQGVNDLGLIRQCCDLRQCPTDVPAKAPLGVTTVKPHTNFPSMSGVLGHSRHPDKPCADNAASRRGRRQPPRRLSACPLTGLPNTYAVAAGGPHISFTTSAW